RTSCCRPSNRCAAPAPARSPPPRCATSSSTARGRSKRSSANSTLPRRPREDRRLIVLVVQTPARLAAEIGNQIRLLGLAEHRVRDVIPIHEVAPPRGRKHHRQ